VSFTVREDSVVKTLRRRTTPLAIATFITLGTLEVSTPPATLAISEGSSIDPDGTLHVRELTIPPSDIWSSEFKEFYAKMVAGTAAQLNFKFPTRDASKIEWVKFDAQINGRYANTLAAALKRYPVRVEDTTLAGVHVGIIEPKDGIAPDNLRRVLVDLHGGGFLVNRGLSFGELESIPVASLGRIKVITVDYRQAPFNGYPAASEDVEAVYRELLKQYRPEGIGIFGCSAGGVLTAQAIARFQTKNLPRPGAIAMLCSSPPIGPALQAKIGDSRIWASGFLPKSEISDAQKTAAKPFGWYMESADDKDSNAYPGRDDAVLAKFPPSLILIGTREVGMSSAIAAHAKLLKLGVDSSLYVMEGATHAVHVMAVDTPEAHDANAYIARWFSQHLAR